MNAFLSSLLSQPQGSVYDLWELFREVQNDCKSISRGLSLTANENVMSHLASSMLRTSLESRYLLGDDSKSGPMASKGSLLYRRLTGVMALETAAREAAQRMLGASHVDFRPLSGVHAMITTLLSVTDPGDTVYSFSPMVGGHFATANILKRAGRRSRFLPWDSANFDIDLDVLADNIRKNGCPKLVFLDHGTTLFPLNVRKLRALLGPNVLIAYDASHTLGLIFGREFQNPLQEGCDILQGNTHKSFPGPQKALIAFRDEAVGRRFSKTLDEGLVSSQHTHHSAALFITILEMDRYGERYAKQMLRNAEALATELRKQGFSLVEHAGTPTGSHVVLIDGCGDRSIREACGELIKVGISTNARPFDGRDILRLGVQELTRRGMKESQMAEIGRLMGGLILRSEDLAYIRGTVTELRGSFEKVHFSFDAELNNNSMILMH